MFDAAAVAPAAADDDDDAPAIVKVSAEELVDIFFRGWLLLPASIEDRLMMVKDGQGCIVSRGIRRSCCVAVGCTSLFSFLCQWAFLLALARIHMRIASPLRVEVMNVCYYTAMLFHVIASWPKIPRRTKPSLCSSLR